MLVAVPPVHPEVAGEERGGDHPGPVVHEALGGQLAHPRVHDRDPGLARAPGVQRPVVGVPGGPGPVVLPGDVGKRRGHLVEEVTPGELPAELLAARAVQRSDRHLERRQAAEPQVGAEPGGRVAGQVVVVLVVAGQLAGPPAVEPLAAGLLAALGQARGGAAAGGREAPWARHGRHPDGPRHRVGPAPGGRAPGPPVRGEDPVVAAAGRLELGWLELGRRHDGQARRQGQVQPVPGAFAFELVAARRGVVRHVVGDVDGVRVHVGGELDHFRGRIADPDHQVAAALAQGLAQVGEGFGQEAGAVRRRGDGRVDHEQRHHLAGPGARLAERRVVVQPEITGEDHDRGVHLPPLGHAPHTA